MNWTSFRQLVVSISGIAYTGNFCVWPWPIACHLHDCMIRNIFFDLCRLAIFSIQHIEDTKRNKKLNKQKRR